LQSPIGGLIAADRRVLMAQSIGGYCNADRRVLMAQSIGSCCQADRGFVDGRSSAGRRVDDPTGG
jgi:hypothetical protein